MGRPADPLGAEQTAPPFTRNPPGRIAENQAQRPLTARTTPKGNHYHLVDHAYLHLGFGVAHIPIR